MQPSCLNCGTGIGPEALYCSRLCRETVEAVRFGRRAVADGRIVEPAVLEALAVKLAPVLRRDFPDRERRVPADLRRRVLERDGGICQVCGDTFASQVERIDPSRPDGLELLEASLRGVCDPCHRRHLAGMSSAAPRAVQMDDEIMRRIRSPEPLRPCDDHVVWGRHW